MADRHREVLQTVYTEVCKAHNDIADFRAKLLALLPIASGTGLLFIILRTQPIPPYPLLAIGIFGVLFTLGLFVYELNGINRCIALIHCGRHLEQELQKELLEEKVLDRPMGMFSDPPPALIKDYLGPKGAAVLIYPTVMGGWGYVISMGLSCLVQGDWNPFLVPGGLLVLGVLIGLLGIEWQESCLRRGRKGVKKLRGAGEEK